jgi:hypothetical protein
MSSCKRYAQGVCEKYGANGYDLRTFTKSLVAQSYRLDSKSSGKAELYKRMKLFTHKLQFCINVGAHRAIDVDSTEELFVVVKGAPTSQQSRQVLLYRRPVANPTLKPKQIIVDAVATYQPPTPVFQPSDVCFYTLGGQEVLLVSDEANDAIHVVRVEENSMKFVRYLTNDCPLVKQSSAMAVDVQGRLWWACQGGKLITIQPRQ